jgi:PAS domain S-box-containing protein
MRKPTPFPNEIEQLEALASDKIQNTPFEEIFDNFTNLASHICGTPFALITLHGETRHWLKDKLGISAPETSLDFLYFSHAIVDDELFEIPNTLEDDRFQDNPLVMEDSGLRFYAGITLITHDGYKLGTLCVIDMVPRQLTQEQRHTLKILAKQVVSEIESRFYRSDLEKLNTELSEKVSFHNSILRSVHSAIITTDTQGEITSFNHGAEMLLGYQANDIIGKQPSIFHDPEEINTRAIELSILLEKKIEPEWEVFVMNAKQGIDETRDWTYVRKDGYRMRVTVTVTAIHDNTKNIAGFMVTATDITASEQTKNALANMADLLQHTGEMAKIGGWELDLVTHDLVWSKEVFRIHEIDFFETPQLDQAIQYYPPEARPLITAAIVAAKSDGTPWDIELPLITAKGNHIWVRAQGSAVFNNGKVVRLIGAFQDITDRKMSELDREASVIALSESARFIKTITDAMPAMVAYWDKDLLCRFANRPYIEWFGKPPEIIIGSCIRTLLGDSLFNMNEPYIRGALAGESQRFERALTKADGSVGYTWANYIPDIDKQGTVKGFYVLVTDISPIKTAEIELKLASSVFNNTIEAIMVTDAKGIIRSVNPAFTFFTGYSADEAVGCTPRILNSGRHSSEFFGDMWGSLRKSRFWHGEILNRSKDGKVHPDLMTVTAVTDSNDAVINYVATFTDITENKLKEQERIAEESKHRDALVREVHHRIKNNLQSVASLLGNFSAQYPELTEPINIAVAQIKSIAVVHGLQGKIADGAVRLRSLIEAISNNNQVLWNSQINLNIQDECSPILVEERESVPLALVLNELILNAFKHGDQLRTVDVSLSFESTRNRVSISISNKARLSSNSAMVAPKFGTGLQLATALLPKKNASLTWEQSGEVVITRIELTTPIIVIESSN